MSSPYSGQPAASRADAPPSHRGPHPPRSPDRDRDRHRHRRDEVDYHLLYVGNLDDNVTSDELEGMFAQFGEVESVKRVTNKNCAFVRFASSRDASEAMRTMNGKLWGSQVMKIGWGRPEPGTSSRAADADLADDNQPTKTLWLGGIHSHETEIFRLFGRYGVIERARVVKTKSCAFLEYRDLASAERARLELGQRLYNEYHIRLKYGKEPMTSSRTWYPEMPSAHLLPGDLPPKKVTHAERPSTERIVEALIPYLLRHGLVFEEFVRLKTENDEHFDFLKENNVELDFYKWKLFEAVMNDFNFDPLPLENVEESDDGEVPPWAQDDDAQ